MSEEKNTIKLKEEELEKVTGSDETTILYGTDEKIDRTYSKNL